MESQKSENEMFHHCEKWGQMKMRQSHRLIARHTLHRPLTGRGPSTAASPGHLLDL